MIGQIADQSAECKLLASDSFLGGTGRYFYKCRPITPSKEALDDAAAERLWLESTRLGSLGISDE
jgi:hypothetical protein